MWAENIRKALLHVEGHRETNIEDKMNTLVEILKEDSDDMEKIRYMTGTRIIK